MLWDQVWYSWYKGKIFTIQLHYGTAWSNHFFTFFQFTSEHVGQATGEHVGHVTGEHDGQVTVEHVALVTGKHIS